MAFTVADVEDLLRVLRENPEWRQRVRLEILGEEVLSLPERMAGVERQLEALVQGQAELRIATQALQDLTIAIDKDIVELRNAHNGRLDNLDGRLYEQGYQALSHVGTQYRRAVRVYLGDIDEVIDARDDGRLDPAEFARLGRADFIIRARKGKGPDAPLIYVVLEVSQTVHASDVKRAADRAAKLRSVGLDAVPWVGGKAIGDGTAALARDLGVHVELDARDG